MDLALERLVTNPACQQGPGGYGTFNPTVLDDTGRPQCTADDAGFKKIVSQLAFAFAPTALHPARTTGYGGFHFSFEAAYTNISSGARYWKLGTRGERDTEAGLESPRNQDPDSTLQLYVLKARKGLGFGTEIGTSVGFMPRTSLTAAGADVRIALLEGFREGIPGYIPDLGIGGGVRTIAGTPQLQLTIASLDIQISKPVVVGPSVVITPWLGYQYLWLFGDSGTIDLTPATNSMAECGYAGDNLPGASEEPTEVDSNGDPVYDGQPICEAGSHEDLNNNTVFEPVRLKRQRALVGMNLRYELLIVGAQIMWDLVTPEGAQTNSTDKADLRDTPRQWTAAFEAGIQF